MFFYPINFRYKNQLLKINARFLGKRRRYSLKMHTIAFTMCTKSGQGTLDSLNYPPKIKA